MITQQRVLATQIPGPKSVEVQQRKLAAVANGVGTGLPVYVEAAEGGIIRDIDGNQLIDLASGIAVTSVGNRNPRVVEAVQRQVEDFTHTCFMVTPYEEYLQVCEALAEVTPGDHPKKTALFNSGAEAVENAVKIARNYTGKRGVVVMDRAFHGRTNLTMGMTAKQQPYKNGFGPFAPEIYRAPMSYPLRDGLTGVEAAKRTITMIEQEVGAANLACVVTEPIQGEGGFVVPAEGYLAAIQKWCNDNDVIFIVDEIQAGMMRTGTWFAFEQYGIEPDVIVASKALSGIGSPVAIIMYDERLDTWAPGAHTGTFRGNQIAFATGAEAVRIVRRDDVLGNVRRRGEQIEQCLSPLRDLPWVRDIRGLGLMWGVELADPRDGRPAPASRPFGVSTSPG